MLTVTERYAGQFGPMSCTMGKAIHTTKQPRRPHYLSEWMEKRQITAAELARQTGADNGQISRWLDGAAPGQKWHDVLRDFFHAGREGIFRHPDDDWATRFFEGRRREEIDRIKKAMEISFPKQACGGATDR